MAIESCMMLPGGCRWMPGRGSEVRLRRYSERMPSGPEVLIFKSRWRATEASRDSAL